jgi:hypothetical protein
MPLRRALQVGLTLLLGLGLLSAPPVGARSSDSGDPEIKVIAEGLSEPRGITFGPRGDLYVAEAGKGGDGPCAAHPILGEACFGKTGAITRISSKDGESVLRRLPSIASEIEGLGPHDVSIDRNRVITTTGLAGTPELRAQFGRKAVKSLGHLLTAETKRHHRGRGGKPESVADLVAYEAEENPDGGAIDSNPFGLLSQGRRAYVADAGANDLLEVRKNGEIRTVAVFPDRIVDFGGQQVPMNAVPTTVVKGPGGDLYVGELTGFPFPIGGARVYRVERGEEPEIYADGFTNIIDIAFGRDKSLYVLEIAHNSLLADEPEGAVIKVDRKGNREVLVDGLFFPGGLVLGKRDEMYVTNCGICFDEGEVLRIKD